MMAQVPEMPILQAWVTHQIKADRLVDSTNLVVIVFFEE